MPWATVRFAETYNRKAEEQGLLGFCSARPALRAALSEVFARLLQKAVGSRGNPPRRSPQRAKFPFHTKRRKGAWGKPSPGVSPGSRPEAVACGPPAGRECRGGGPCDPMLRGFFLSCQKETPQTPKAANGRWYLRCAPHCRKPFRKPGRRQMPPGAAWLRFARAANW